MKIDNLDNLMVRGITAQYKSEVEGFLLKHRGDATYGTDGGTIEAGDYIIYDYAEKIDTGHYGCFYKVIPESVVFANEEIPCKFIEKRAKRLQLVLQPSVYERAKAKAKADGYKSLNDYIHKLLEYELYLSDSKIKNATEKHKDGIALDFTGLFHTER